MGPGRRALVLMLAAPTLALGACGDSDPDAEEIEKIVEEIAADSSALCEHGTSRLIALIGGSREVCEQAARGYETDPAAGVDGDIEVKVTGDTASAQYTTNGGANRSVTFVRQGDEWLIDTVTG